MGSGPDNDMTAEQRITSVTNRVDDLADDLEEMTEWDGKWRPPQTGKGSEKLKIEMTVKELKALRRAARSKALSHYNRRGFSRSYMKYNFIYQKLGGKKLQIHKNDPKYIKIENDNL